MLTWVTKYSRPIAQLVLLLLCATILLAVGWGHRWAPLIVFLAYLLLSAYIRRKLPAPSIAPEQIRRIQFRVSSSYRTMAIFGVILMSPLTLLLLANGLIIRDMPRWAAAVMLVVGWLSVWHSFRMARLVKSRTVREQEGNEPLK